jgi:isoprenylcysteine carboxyl methyltransferase (ICMT) family protein YpbQ
MRQDLGIVLFVQIIKLPNHQTTKSSNYQIIKLPNHQTTKSSNYQIIKLPNHQTTKSSNYQIIIHLAAPSPKHSQPQPATSMPACQPA